MIRVVVAISGGNLEGVYITEGEAIDFELVDFDNLAAEGKTNAQQERILRKATKGLMAI